MDTNPGEAAPAGWNFDNTYVRLPEALFTRVRPVPVRRPEVVVLNDTLAAALGLDAEELRAGSGARVFGGNAVPPGADPIAQAYAGHQFGHFTNLGDGRAVLLGEQVAPGGRRVDIQLKGSGPTPFSRRGDGRAALGPMLREHIVSEAMHALGIPTTRSLAVVATGEGIFREEALPGAVLARVAASHIRVGTFEYAAAIGDVGMLRALLDHAQRRHFPEVRVDDAVAGFFGAVVEAQASLLARWMSVGFIHGVMNTDNMAVSGETIDYGPCAFLEAYDPGAVFSSIDRHGRYAYGKQPEIAHWNLARLAEALLPLWHEDRGEAVARAEEALAVFPVRFQDHWLGRFRAKLGLRLAREEDRGLVADLLAWMQETKADFTAVFASMAGFASADAVPEGDRLAPPPVWLEQWRARLAREEDGVGGAALLMGRTNPLVIPRNHLVEEALEAAGAGDLSVMDRLLSVLADPFSADGVKDGYTRPAPEAFTASYRTFCGT